MAVSREEIKEALGQMPVMELVELIKELEESWGVSAAAVFGCFFIYGKRNCRTASGNGGYQR